MARPGKLVQLGVESTALDCRARGLSLDDTVEHINHLLAVGGISDTVGRSAVARYYATVGSASVAVAHTPQAAAENVSVLRDVGVTLVEHHARLCRWADEADAQRRVRRDSDGDARDDGPDWHARFGASRELREHTRLIANIADSIFSAQRIESFQQAVLGAIEEADVETASRVRASLRARHELRRAELLGA